MALEDSTLEEWRPTVGYEGLYEVSSHGRIRRVSPTHLNRNVGGLLNPWSAADYHRVELCIEGNNATFGVHQLVAEAFLGPCPPDREVNHKNGVKHDNRAENLEYLTHQENMAHAGQVLGVMGSRGTKNGRSKLTEGQVQEARDRHAGGESCPMIAKRFGVGRLAIQRVVNGKRWNHVS